MISMNKLFAKGAFASLLILGFLLLETGCNCEHKGSGWVYHRTTRQPMEGVEVAIHLSSVHDDTLSHRVYTDADGAFSFQHSYCTNYMVEYHREGYIGFVADLTEGDTIWLEEVTEEYQ